MLFGEVVGQVVDGGFWNDNFDIDDRFEYDWFGGMDCFDNCFVVGYDESYFFVVDGVGFVVENGDFQVVYCIIGDDIVFQGLMYVFFDSWYEDVWNDVVFDCIDEFEVFVVVFWFDVQMYFVELVGVVVLFFVVMYVFGWVGNCFVVGNVGWFGIDFQFVLVDYFFQFGFEVDFVKVVNDCFVVGWMVFDDESWIFYCQFVENVEQMLFVVFFFCFDGQIGYWFGKFEGYEMDMVFVM